ncbi:uncharacterized protein [Panulirus ornatus]|uniref:uncharacterized protein n=1 Tax=Panulirus ornatus TaxID=150431 RepID=UPI003A856DC7
MEDEDCDHEPTLEEIISSVLKTKSKFGKVKLVLPPLRRHRVNNLEKEDRAPENKDSFKAKTETPGLYLLQNGKAEGSGNINSLTHLDHNSEKSVDERDAVRSKEDMRVGNCPAHRGSWSTSKMKHSLSTPEVRSKYIQKHTTTKGLDDSKLSVIHQVNFSSMSNTSTIVGDKENNDPVTVPHDGSKGRSATALDTNKKDLDQKSLELSCKPLSYFLDKNPKEIRGGIESKVYNTQIQSIFEKIKPFNGEILLKKGETFLSPENTLKENDQTYKSRSLHRHVSSQKENDQTDKSGSLHRYVSQQQSGLSDVKSHVLASLQKQDNICSHGTQKTADDQKMQMLKLTNNTAAGTGIAQNTACVETAPTPAIESVHSISAKGTSQTLELCPTSSEVSRCISKASPLDGGCMGKPSSKSATECMPLIATPSSSQHTTAVSSQHSTSQSNSENIVMSKTSQNTVPYRGTPHVNVISDGIKSSLETPGHSRNVSHQFQTPSIGKRAYPLPPTPPTAHKLKQMDHIAIKGKEYLLLGLLGMGGSSKVYEVLDVETRKVKAVKLVDLKGLDNSTLNSYKNEISILQRLQWSDRVIRLYDYCGDNFVVATPLRELPQGIGIKVLDVETRKVKAVKLVDLKGLDNSTLNSYKNEISILQRLQWSDRVIRLYDYELSGSRLNLVMEKGNCDLASILNNVRNKKASHISPFTIQHYWHGMLLAVQAIHKEGIIHSDLKPANFLLVDETVKLIDFGIASAIQQDMTSVIKDNQVRKDAP